MTKFLLSIFAVAILCCGKQCKGEHKPGCPQEPEKPEEPQPNPVMGQVSTLNLTTGAFWA